LSCGVGAGSAVLGFRLTTNHNMERIAILAIWFVLLLGIRFSISFVLSNIWVGTVGAVAITFAIFYVVIRHTPFSKYADSVDSALRYWYSKRYVLFGIVGSMIVLGSIMVLADIGYLYHKDRIISIWELRSSNSIDDTRARLTESIDSLRAQGYSQLDTTAIIVASVDKSLDGHYLQAVSFILAEDIELLAFVLVLKRIGSRGIFSPAASQRNKNEGKASE